MPAASGPRTGGPAAARGTPLVLTHGRSAKALLRIDWDHPVYVPPEEQGTRTRAARGALAKEEALRIFAGDDQRPLLVLRECEGCEGTDLALLRTDLPNERTLLLSGFFHCVRVTASVAEPNHPFHALFDGHMHLFLCNADGSGRVDLDGRQSQGELWKAMRSVLARDGKVDLDRADGKLQQWLAQLDRLDEQETVGLKALDAELERRGDGSRRVKALQAELQAIGKERAAIFDSIRKLGRKVVD